MTTIESIFDSIGLRKKYAKKFAQQDIKIEDLTLIDKPTIRKLIKDKTQRKLFNDWVENQKNNNSESFYEYEYEYSDDLENEEKTEKIEKTEKSVKSENKQKNLEKSEKPQKIEENDKAQSKAQNKAQNKAQDKAQNKAQNIYKKTTINNISFINNINKINDIVDIENKNTKNSIKAQPKAKLEAKSSLIKLVEEKDEFNLLSGFMLEKEPPKIDFAAIAAKRRRRNKKALKSRTSSSFCENEDPLPLDNIIDLMNSSIEKTGFKEEELKRPEILDDVHEIMEQFIKMLQPIQSASEFSLINPKNIEINQMQQLLNILFEAKTEALNFGERIIFGRTTYREIDGLISTCEDLLSHLYKNVLKQNFEYKKYFDLIKLIYDTKFLLEYFVSKREDTSSKEFVGEYEKFIDQNVQKALSKLSSNFCDNRFKNDIYRLIKFERDFLIYSSKNITGYICKPLLKMSKFFHEKFKKFELIVTEKTTIQAISFAVKIFKLVERKNWKSRKSINMIFTPLQEFFIKPDNILHKIVYKEATKLSIDAITNIKNFIDKNGIKIEKNDKKVEKNDKKIEKNDKNDQKNKITLKCYKNNTFSIFGHFFQKEFEKITDFILTVISDYPKSIISGKILDIFASITEQIFNAFLLFLLEEKFEFGKIFARFAVRNCSKKKKKFFKKYDEFFGDEQILDYDQLILLCSDIAVAMESLESTRELLLLEFENVDGKSLGTHKFAPKINAVVLTIAFELIFVKLEDSLSNLYTRNKEKELNTFEDICLEDLNEEIDYLKDKLNPFLHQKMFTSIFIALIIALNHKILNGKSYFLRLESDILLSDLRIIYDIFKELKIDTSVEDIDHIIALKQIILALHNPPKDLISQHLDYQEEKYPSNEEYYPFFEDNTNLMPCSILDESGESLNKVGVLQLISRFGEKNCQKYVKCEKKNIDKEIVYISVLKLSHKESSILAYDEDTEFSDILPKMPRLLMADEGEKASFKKIEKVESGNLYGISELKENQILKRNKWEPSIKPPHYSDENYNKKTLSDQLPETENKNTQWRWATDWLIDSNGWNYTSNFKSKKFKKANLNLLLKARTRTLIRFRVFEELDHYDDLDTFEIYKCLRNLLSTMSWSAFKLTTFFVTNESEEHSKTSTKSISKTSTKNSKNDKNNKKYDKKDKKYDKNEKNSEKSEKNNKKIEKSKIMEEKDIFKRLNDKEEIEGLVLLLGQALEATKFSVEKGRKSIEANMVDLFDSLLEMYEEIYADEGKRTVKETRDYLKKIIKICGDISGFKANKLCPQLSLMFLNFVLDLIKNLSEADGVEPLESISYMQQDVVSEGKQKIFDFGLPYVDLIMYLSTSVEDLIIDSNPKNWVIFEKEYDGVEKLKKKFDLIQKWLQNYHSRFGDVENYAETVCRLFESYWFIADTLSKIAEFKVNVRANLRKIMQQSIKNSLANIEKDKPKIVADWEAKDWSDFTKRIKDLLENEVDGFQNDIFIPGFDDPCKNTIIPILSKTLLICEKSIEKQELDASFLQVLKFYSEIEQLMEDWNSNNYFSSKVISNMRKFLPSVENKIKVLLKHIVRSQYDKIVPWITASKKNEKLLENGKFTTFYSDSFSYISNFVDLFSDLLFKLPKSQLKNDIFVDFRDVFDELIFTFIDLNSNDIASVDEILSESPVLKVNRRSRNRRDDCKIKIFKCDYNDYEYEGSDDEELELDDLNVLLCRYSNLCLGLNRVITIGENLNSKIRKHTGKEDFNLDIKISDYQNAIDEMVQIIAHKVIFIDLGDILFLKSHYKRQTKNQPISTEFNSLDSALGEILSQIRQNCQLEKSVVDVWQGIYDVYISVVQWLLVGSSKNKFNAKDMAEIRADFDLFDLFSTENFDVLKETFELKSLNILLDNFSRGPEKLIIVHKQIASRKNDTQKTANRSNASLNMNSRFVVNPFCGAYFNIKDDQISITANGLLAVIEHFDSKETQQYFKEFLKKNKGKIGQNEANEGIDLNGILINICVEFDNIPKLIELTNTVEGQIPMESTLTALKKFEAFQMENQSDSEINWKIYFKPKTLKSCKICYEKALKYSKNFQIDFDPEKHLEIIQTIFQTIARFGFVLKSTGIENNYNPNLIKNIIAKSSKNKYKHFRKNFPEYMSHFTTPDWQKFNQLLLKYFDAQIGPLSTALALPEINFPIESSLIPIIEALGEELKDTLAIFDYDAISEISFVESIKMCKLVQSYINAVVQVGDYNGEDAPKSPLSPDFCEALKKSFPDSKEEILKRVESMLNYELKKVANKLKSVMNNPNYTKKGEDGYSKYCSIFKKMLNSYKKNVFAFLNVIPVEVRPPNIDDLVFLYLNKFISKFLEFNFSKIALINNFFLILSKAEEEYLKDTKSSFSHLILTESAKIIKSGINENDKCFDLSEICLKFLNVTNINSILQSQKYEILEMFDQIDIECKSTHNMTEEIYHVTEKLLEMAGFAFLCLKIGDDFFGKLFRRRKGELAGTEKIAAKFKAQIENLEEKSSKSDFSLAFDSICSVFFYSFKWLLLESNRKFTNIDSDVLSQTFDDLLAVLINFNSRIIRNQKVDHIKQIITLFSNMPEENIRNYKNMKRTNKKHFKDTNLILSDVLKIISSTESTSAQKFAAKEIKDLAA